MKIQLPFPLMLLLWVSINTGCEKEITVDLPETTHKLVVEGSIETGLPPIVILTRSVGYFDPTDLATFRNLFVHDAEVYVSNGTQNVLLQEVCASQIPDSLLPIVTAVTGISEENLTAFDYCVYTTFNTSVWGEVGKTYTLTVDAENQHLTSKTMIHDPIPLDSLWFEVYGNADSLGLLWAILDDPAGEHNAYRWWAQRINRGPEGDPKDRTFVTPDNSVFDDQFFDGLEFEFAYDRGSTPDSEADDDFNIERGLFKTGDTVVVRFSTIDPAVMEFFRAVETQQLSNGNPFAAPAPVPVNIEGGLGVWVGYSAVLDTVICLE